MASVTFNPVSGAVSPCDGRLSVGFSNVWATTRNDTGINVTASVTNATEAIQAEYVSISSVYAISRNVINFNTSSLGAGATITGAVLSFFSTGGNSAETTHPANIVIVSASPASKATLATTDYATANFGSTRFATDYSIATFVAGSGSYQDITLNASGIAYINKTGVTSFGMRGAPDVDNVDPTTSGLRSFATFDMADNGSNAPKLTITYTAPTNSGFFSHS